MPNQPIPFKQHSTGPDPGAGQAADEAPEGPAGKPGRPPGEVGGHTVQPWEQDPVPATTSPNSKDVPPPEAGAPGAGAPGTGAGKKTTEAPYNVPSQTSGTQTTDQPPVSTNPGQSTAGATSEPSPKASEGAAAIPSGDAGTSPAASPAAAPGATRPPRPPVYSPQQGHEPAPRPPPSHLPTAGLGTEGDRLVAAISRAIAENLGKAFHQSVAQAVREVMPLSGRSLDQGRPQASNGGGKGAAGTKAGTGAKADGGARAGNGGNGRAPAPHAASSTADPASAQANAATRRDDAGTGQHGPPPSTGKEAPESPGPTGSTRTGREGIAAEAKLDASPAGRGDDPSTNAKGDAGLAPGERRSQYGGVIEPPVEVPADRSPPGNPAAAAAEDKRQGDLV